MLVFALAFAAIAFMRYIPDLISKVRQTPAERASAPSLAPQKQALPTKDIDETRKALDAQIGKEIATQSRSAAVQIRRALGEQMHVKLDVDVLVLGSAGDRIRLRSPKIDAAWAEEFRKGDAARELREAGFTRVELRGAHGYRESWRWAGMPEH